MLTDDAGLAERVRTLRNYGSKVKYYNEVKGYNSRLDPLQAAFLRVKLKHLDEWNSRREQIAGFYLDEMEGIPGLVLPHTLEQARNIWHIFPVRHPQREALQAHLKANGVDTLIHYPVPPHLSGAYAEMGLARGAFPISEEIADTELSLPMGPHLSLQEAGYVVEVLRAFRG